MKRFQFLQLALIALVVVIAVSCGIPRSVSDEYYDDYPSGNVYYGNPYNRAPIILQRDPLTGRYYEVTPYGAYAYPTAPYGYSRDYRYRSQGRVYDNRNNNNNNNNYRKNNESYRNNNNDTYNRNSQNDAQQRQNREEARKRVLGDKNH